MPLEDAATIRAVTYALTQPDTALAAIAALEDCEHVAASEGLIEAIYEPVDARCAVKAIAALTNVSAYIAADALVHALTSEHVTVRLAAAQALGQRRPPQSGIALTHIIETDSTWMVRRAAVRALGGFPE